MTRRIGTRVVTFGRSVALVAVLVVVLPWGLAAAARARFGGPAPWHGVTPVRDWELAVIRDAMTERVSDATLADIVIRAALAVAWSAVITIAVTVVLEVAHMVRHDGLPMPDVRGLVPTQRVARVIASGLLVVMPLIGAPSRALARDGAGLLAPAPAAGVRAELVVGPEVDLTTAAPGRAAGAYLAPGSLRGTPAPRAGNESDYTVVAGDSVYGIAERFAGPDPDAIAEYADRLLDLNLGTEMVDGRHFTNAAFLDVGWVLRLPAGPFAESAGPARVGEMPPDSGGERASGERPDGHTPGHTREHVVAPGESLWSIAGTELADPTRWGELYEANDGRTFADGRVLSDPDLIHPGWALVVPGTGAPTAVDAETAHATDVAVTVGDNGAAGGQDGADGAGSAGDAGTAAGLGGADEAGPAGDAGTAAGQDGADEAGAVDGSGAPGGRGGADGAGSVGDGAGAPDAVGPDSVGGAEPDRETTADVDVDDGADLSDTATDGADDGAGGADEDAIAGEEETTADASPDGEAGVAPDGTVSATGEPSPTNVWIAGAAGAPGGAVARSGDADPGSDVPVAPAAEGEAPQLLTLGRAAMLSTGVLTLLAVRRRNRLRGAPPRARLPVPTPAVAATERAVRAVDAGERFARVEVAIRAAALPLVERGHRVLAVLIAADGELELRATGPVELPAPWRGGGDRWWLDASTPIELLAEPARRVGAPCPALVQLGQEPGGRDVYVDLEALGVLAVGGPRPEADAVVAALAATLASSVLAEVSTLIGLGIDDEALLGHRHRHIAGDVAEAFAVAAEAVGTTALAPAPTFELRARVTSGEAWEPAIVLIGSRPGGADDAPVVVPGPTAGIAVVSAAPIDDATSRLVPDGEQWSLEPAGIRVAPIGLSPSATAALGALVTVPEPIVSDPVSEPAASVPQLPDHHHDDDGGDDDPRDGDDDDITLVVDLEGTADPDRSRSAAVSDGTGAAAGGDVAELRWELLVRLFGPGDVIDRSGTPAVFTRSKTRELVAWLATHRDRATRTAARTALWELDVRDATFANVVSEARRALARLVPPPEGEEWVGRTMTDALPIHDLVRTDADVIEQALASAALQPPAQAIATLSPAVELIVDMPFAGTAYLWPDAEGLASNLVLLATSAAGELAAHCLSVGDVDGVFRATGRGLRVLPGHEELIGLRMQAHARAGDQAGVRHEWESYERVLTADPWSDGEPSPKLVQLRSRLLNPSR